MPKLTLKGKELEDYKKAKEQKRLENLKKKQEIKARKNARIDRRAKELMTKEIKTQKKDVKEIRQSLSDRFGAKAEEMMTKKMVSDITEEQKKANYVELASMMELWRDMNNIIDSWNNANEFLRERVASVYELDTKKTIEMGNDTMKLVEKVFEEIHLQSSAKEILSDIYQDGDMAQSEIRDWADTWLERTNDDLPDDDELGEEVELELLTIGGNKVLYDEKKDKYYDYDTVKEVEIDE